MAYKLKPLSERVSPRQYERHRQKVDSHYYNHKWNRKRQKKGNK